MRVSKVLVVTLLLVQACKPGADPSTQARPTDANSCAWSARAGSTSSVTYVSDGKLYGVSTQGGGRACLLSSLPRDPVVSWGPQAERVLLAADRAVLPSGKEIAPFTKGTDVVWSTPGGKSILAVTADGRLLKRRTIEPKAVDVSFLRRHDEATYHPAGRHILSIGVDRDGTYGIFRATNDGRNVRALAVSESARRIYSLVAVPSGEDVFYVADHGTYRDVHSLSIESPNLDTLYKTNDPVVGITEPFRGPHSIAVQLGSCRTATRTVIVYPGSNVYEQISGLPAGASTEPVGWLPRGELLLLARERGCDGQADLYIARQPTDEFQPRMTKLLVRSVDSAAPRVVAPPPPEPLRSSTDPPEA